MSEFKGSGPWVPIKEADVTDVLKRRDMATYVVANWLRSLPRYKAIKTSQVLHRLKQMEKNGLVSRVTDSRNPYSRQLVWELSDKSKPSSAA